MSNVVQLGPSKNAWYKKYASLDKLELLAAMEHWHAVHPTIPARWTDRQQGMALFQMLIDRSETHELRALCQDYLWKLEEGL